MRYLLLLLMVTISVTVAAQWPWQKIEGNGQLKKETRSVGSFTAIGSSGSWDVMVAYGEPGSIQVEGDENLLPYIETYIKDGKLQIQARKSANLRSKNKITVYVTVTKLTAVTLSGSGDIIGDGNFSYDGTIDCKVSGSGNIRLGLKKAGQADISVSGSGKVILKGAAKTVNVKISGSGGVDCAELNSDDANVNISGSGDVKLFVNRSIDAGISGSGTVRYRGAATDIRKHISGSGTVRKVE
jgi:hypothetical protein